MKIKLLLIYISIIFFSCKNSEHYNSINGSWYNVNKDKGTYEEIHIDDSLFIYCFDNCDVLIPFKYFLNGDSIYLGSDKKNISQKHQILVDNSIKGEMCLIMEHETLTFKKLDETYENLNDFLVDYESLDSLSYDYFHRRNNILNSLKDTLTGTSVK